MEKGKYKIGICGHYGGNKNYLDGQTVKTKTITKQLKLEFGNDNVVTVDTYGGARKIVKTLFNLIRLMFTCDDIIILPAHNGIQVFAPFVSVFNVFFKKRIHYVVIGGWLPSFVDEKPIVKKALQQFNSIFVETTTMSTLLKNRKFNNIVLLKNCKQLDILDESELCNDISRPLRICTFSRILEKKGIEDIVNVIQLLNQNAEETIYKLDLYGQVDSNYMERFEHLQKEFPAYIEYKGEIPFNKSVNVLREYFALIFPTRFFTEGIPGTIIDAYASGVPVVAARWQSFDDVIKEGVTGLGFEFESKDALYNLLKVVSESPEMIIKMKKDCIKEAKSYLPESALEPLIRELRQKEIN